MFSKIVKLLTRDGSYVANICKISQIKAELSKKNISRKVFYCVV